MRRLALLLTLSLAFVACDRTLVVRADPTGTTKLPLSGDSARKGTLTRAIQVGARTVPEGTRVTVYETWLLRQEEGANPPGYRITGLYDPSQRSDGLVLPRGTIDVYFVSALDEDRNVQVPVPREALRLD